MERRRFLSRILFPICTTLLILWTSLSLFGKFTPLKKPILPHPLHHIYLRFAQTLQKISNFNAPSLWDISTQPSDSQFSPPSFYERDARGAIDIFRKNGLLVCRIYVACRDQSSQILLPLWMRNYANILSNKCSLSNFRFVHYSRLRNFPSAPAVYDWIGPQVDVDSLNSFVSKTLPNFYVANNQSRSKLSPSTKLLRTCLCPRKRANLKLKNLSICNVHPEPRIARPIIIPTSSPQLSSSSAFSEFQKSIREIIRDYHAVEAVVLSQTSELLGHNRICFRSLISGPTFTRTVNTTNPTASILEMLDDQNNSNTTTLGQELEEDRVDKEQNKDNITFDLDFFTKSLNTSKPDFKQSEFLSINGSIISVVNCSGNASVSPGCIYLQGTTTLSSFIKNGTKWRNYIQSTKSKAFNNSNKPHSVNDSISLSKFNSTMRDQQIKNDLQFNNVSITTAPANSSSSVHLGVVSLDNGMQKKTNATESGTNDTTIIQQNISRDGGSVNKNKGVSSSTTVVESIRYQTNFKRANNTERFLVGNTSITLKPVPNGSPSEIKESIPPENTTKVGLSGEPKKDNISNESTSIIEAVSKEGTNNSSFVDDLIDLKNNLTAKFQILDSLLEGKNHEVSKVKVDELLMYDGGVELFTHHSVDPNIHKAVKLSENSNYGVCRIYKACRNENSSLLLPAWLKKFQTHMNNHCGLTNVKFIPTIEFNIMYKDLVEGTNYSNRINDSVRAGHMRHRKNAELEMDLVGTRVYREQQQHFVTDLFHEGIHSIDAILNYPSTNERKFRRNCIYQGSNPDEKDLSKLYCDNDESYRPAFRPAFVLNDLVKTQSRSARFIVGLLSMIPPNSHRDRMMFNSHLSHSAKDGATCFRSIVVTRNRYPPKSVLSAEERNSFFEYNRISRESVVNQAFTKGKFMNVRDRLQRINGADCNIRLTVLQPKIVQKGSEQPGTIENEDEVINEAIRISEAMALLHGLKGIKLKVNRFHQDGKGAQHVANVIQKSHLILGGNDPSMTSIMFARPQTAVIEIQPFGYSAGPYRSFAEALNLTYASVMSKPDILTFEKCVNEKYERSWNEDIPRNEMEARMNGLMQLYRESADEFNGLKSMIDLTSRRRKGGPSRQGYIPLERVCARKQRLDVDAEVVGRLLAESAAAICELQLEAIES